jgi:hypothetical protein
MLEKKFQRIFPLKREKVQNDFFLDVDQEHDLVTRRSITGILVLLNNDSGVINSWLRIGGIKDCYGTHS